ncbi:PBSX family phage terminase large subunit, partial [Fructobacillus fructosus]|nr:PBSX family phage terminase large subunit [Fructobacillus fructosus]
MKLSAKQHQVISEVNRNLGDLSLIILYGAKRSGKTFLNNLLFLMLVANAKKNADEVGVANPQYILA